MPSPAHDTVKSLTAGISERLRDLAGNVAILGVVALLALTVWVVCIAGLVTLLKPLWGMVGALFFIALLIVIMALILLAVLRRRVRLQRARADFRQASMRRKARMNLLATLPGLLRKRSGAMVVIAGLAVGATIVAALQNNDDE